MVFEHEVLSDSAVATSIARDFVALHIDLDMSPQWADVEGFRGLPALVFFDRFGRHVLTRSGYRTIDDTITLFTAVSIKLESGELAPYPAPPPARAFAEHGLEPADLKRELTRLEFEIFLRINSHDGGFSSPARHPYPALLVELERWRQVGAPERVGKWIDHSIESALRGFSPRLEGQPLADMDFSARELADLSKRRSEAGPRWREGIDRLPQADPYRGLQDPFDGGVFRYCAGPGWYNPHFERRAHDNLAWAELAALQHRNRDADALMRFVNATFAQGDQLATSQRSDPFYYRLRADERRGVPAPSVAPIFRLEVQARAAQVDPQRCAQLLQIQDGRWPLARWTHGTGSGKDPSRQHSRHIEDEASEEATPDAVGELLVALANCRKGPDGEVYREPAEHLLAAVLERWREPLPSNPRLFGLARGICRAAPEQCGRALATVEGLPLALAQPPPLAEYAVRLAAVQSERTPNPHPEPDSIGALSLAPASGYVSP